MLSSPSLCPFLEMFMSPELIKLVQQILIGLTIGSYLALIALGYTMVYGIIELINFAHGDLFAFGFFISLTLFTVFNPPVPLDGFGLLVLLPIIFILTMLLT